MKKQATVSISDNFQHNLASIQCFWEKASCPEQYESLLDHLFDSIIPVFEHHPSLGTDYLMKQVKSVETEQLQHKLRQQITTTSSVRYYHSDSYTVLYLLEGDQIVLLAIKHQHQLSFEFY